MTLAERTSSPAAPTLHVVVEALHRYIDEAIERAPASATLWEEIRRASTGGKLVRPRLLMTTHRALGGADQAAAARAAAGFELLHTAFLIHDDVIDHDWVRRGEPNVAAAFRAASLSLGRRAEVAEHFGISAAIVAGDLAVAGAVQLIEACSSVPAVRARLGAIVMEAVSATAAGELMDVELASAAEPGLAAVLAMYEAKTGVYTFCGPLQTGAVLAGADDAAVDALGRAGLALGVAYQIADDLLGLFGDPATTGKSAVSDAREGKHTVLAALLADRGERTLALLDPSAASPEELAARLREAVERSGVRAAATALAEARIAEARTHLAAVPASARIGIEELLGDLQGRIA
jgi:geranylgeranyl diphosphate synthase, type II